MKIKVEIDISNWLKSAALILRKLPYATNNAITRVAKEAVTAGQNEIAAQFTIRKRFIIQRFKILQYSRVSNLEAIVGMDASNVQGSPLILGFFEEGQSGDKLPMFGPGLAVPITGSPARPDFSASVPNALKYQNLQLGPDHKGKKKTFIVPGVGVFERIRPGNDPGATVLIYAFESKVQLRARVSIRRLITDLVAARFATIWREEFTREVTNLRR